MPSFQRVHSIPGTLVIAMSEWNLVSFLWAIDFPAYFKTVVEGHVTLIYFTKLILKSDFAAAGVKGVKVNMAHVYPFFSSQMLPETVPFTQLILFWTSELYELCL